MIGVRWMRRDKYFIHFFKFIKKNYDPNCFKFYYFRIFYPCLVPVPVTEDSLTSKPTHLHLYHLIYESFIFILEFGMVLRIGSLWVALFVHGHMLGSRNVWHAKWQIMQAAVFHPIQTRCLSIVLI
jgi:hypothetical protein